MLTEFLLVYGLLILFAVSAVALTCFLANSAEKNKALQARVRSLEEKLDAFSERAGDESRKQRRLLTESVSGLNESMTRAILALADRRGGDEAEQPSVAVAAAEGAVADSEAADTTKDAK